MANTRFKTENGLLVTGGNAQFEELVSMANSLIVDGDLVLVRGDLQVEGTQVFSGGQVYTSDIVADVDGLKLGNTTNQFDAFLGTTRIYDALIPVGNTVPLGNTTNRWVITANTLNLSGNADITGNVAITGAVTLSNTLTVTGLITTSANLNVVGTINASANLKVGTYATGTVNGVNITNNAFIIGNTSANAILTGSSLSINSSAATLNVGTSFSVNSITLTAGSVNASFDSGVLFVDATNNRVGINNTAPGVALRVTGAADISLTANIQGNANVGGTLGVSGATNVATLGVSGNLMVTDSSRVHYIAGNSVFGGGALTINSVEGRVGIGTSTPDVTFTVSGSSNVSGAARFGSLVTIAGTMSVTGAANVLNTLGISGAANALGTLGITGSANALSTLGVNGLLTAAAGLNSTGAINVGTYATGTVNGVNITNNALIIGNTAANAILTGSSLSINSTSASLNVGTSFTVNNTVLATGTSTNVNMDGGVLFVDALNNRVGINSTTPGVALRVTGAADISLTANIQGNANVGGTLGVSGITSLANSLAINTPDSGTFGALSTPLRVTKVHQTSDTPATASVQGIIANAAQTDDRNNFGIYTELYNRSLHRTAAGVDKNPGIVGIGSYVYNGTGNARAQAIYGVLGISGNYANGTVANTVAAGYGGAFEYYAAGSGTTTTATGVIGTVVAVNSAITGNITTAHGVRSSIAPSAAMTITTGHLFLGEYASGTLSRTTNRYGIYIDGESNNYFSGNVHVAGAVNAASYRIGADSLVINATTIALGPFGTTNGVNITTTSIDVGNTVANAALDYNIVYVANSTARANLNPISLSLGNTTANAIVNSSSILVGSIGTSNGLLTNTSTIIVGNTSVNARVTSTSLVLGNTTVNSVINSSSLAINSNSAIRVPVGTTADRPTNQVGLIRYNTSLNQFEGYGTAWGTIGGGAVGGGSDQVFYENGQTVTTNYTISTDKNAMSAGPITINNGVTVTIPTNSRWVIV